LNSGVGNAQAYKGRNSTRSAAGPQCSRATLPPTNIFMPPLSKEDYQALVINVEQWLRSNGPSRTSLSLNDVGDAIRECLAHGELERAQALLKLAGGRLKSGAELRFLERVWQRESAAAKP